jgi:hypothetical protein
MALYKARGLEPLSSVRIDGVVWSAPGPGATIRGWVYPTMAPSPRFLRFNSDARTMGEGWASLTATQRSTWVEWARVTWDWWYLLCWLRWYQPYASDLQGEEAYASVNLWRAQQGLGPVVEPPAIVTTPAHDYVQLAAGPPVTAEWHRDAGPVGPAHYLALWARACLTVPEHSGLWSKDRWGGLVPIGRGVPVDISGLLAASGMYAAGFGCRVRLMIMEVGSMPFFGCQEMVPVS